MDYGLWTQLMDGGDVAAIIPAAGIGRRFCGPTQKLFVRLDGLPLLVHTLRVMQRSPAVHWIVLVVRAGEERHVTALVRHQRLGKVSFVCAGGASRAASVAKGFAALPDAAQWVLVHDAARPCLSATLIQHAVAAAQRHGAVACGLPATLTVKAVDQRGRVQRTLDRSQLWLIQTPQVFRRAWFAQALARAGRRLERFSDDAALVEAAGYPVRIISGDPFNLKVTTHADLVLAEAVLRWRKSHGRSVAGNR